MLLWAWRADPHWEAEMAGLDLAVSSIMARLEATVASALGPDVPSSLTSQSPNSHLKVTTFYHSHSIPHSMLRFSTYSVIQESSIKLEWC